MYYFKRWIMRLVFRTLGKTPLSMPMVQYWKGNNGITAAKLTRNKGGEMIMRLEGEKESFAGFPRGHLLFGTLSKLKHEIKNQIFNEAWGKLEANVPVVDVVKGIKSHLVNGLRITDDKKIPVGKFGDPIMDYCFYDMLPPEKMVPSVREIWRVMSLLEKEEPRLRWLKLALTYILQEDDAYRYRVQWIVPVLRGFFLKNPVEALQIALEELENAEIIGDMKAKIRLLRRVLMAVMEDRKARYFFVRFFHEIDWKKVKLTKADKYHFRGKWFKVDMDKFEY